MTAATYAPPVMALRAMPGAPKQKKPRPFDRGFSVPIEN
jgi:hypothetical protein